ncbi:unnamed protein product [Cylicocyclus nassatus]|uniref:G-protein coupled receptors family 1 profile domain-containing protein n=1 Tax=Cylicocyclus nassatus TaxID=53992 RepID=A0AA36H5D4_CYLNA|nr:unnamed protein product [Cylicocyclus nassatus]
MDVNDAIPAPMTIITIGICAAGVFGNLMIIFASLKSSKLRSPCNLLMCALALADVVVCIHLIHVRIMILQGLGAQKNSHCFWHTIYGMFALNVESGLGLALGIDRFLAVFLPTRYVILFL